MKEENKIDELFKAGLSDPEIPFNEDHWLAMEQRLAANKKKRVLPLWLTVTSGIAAALIIALFWLKPGKTPVVEKTIVETQQPFPGKQEKLNTATAKNQLRSKSRLSSDRNQMYTGKKPYPSDQKQGQIPAVSNTSDLKEPLLAFQNDASILDSMRLSASTSLALSRITPVHIEIAQDKEKPSRLKSIKKTSINGGRLVLSILAAPDVSNVHSAGHGGLGANVGAQLSVRLTSKLSVTSGIAYSKKYYDTDFSFYHPSTPWNPSVSPSNVAADCDVIDVPINVNYKVFQKFGNSITLTSGLSSYFMLKERYDFTFDPTSTSPQRQYGIVINNQNQHILGIANIAVTFQHQITNRFSISAQPFVKLPLTDIGFGNTRLKSTGLAVSFNINMFR